MVGPLAGLRGPLVGVPWEVGLGGQRDRMALQRGRKGRPEGGYREYYPEET